jgi:hypothetical protein
MYNLILRKRFIDGLLAGCTVDASFTCPDASSAAYRLQLIREPRIKRDISGNLFEYTLVECPELERELAEVIALYPSLREHQKGTHYQTIHSARAQGLINREQYASLILAAEARYL